MHVLFPEGSQKKVSARRLSLSSQYIYKSDIIQQSEKIHKVAAGCFKRYTNAVLKTSVYVRVHIKTMP